MDQFLAYKKGNLGPVFNFTAYIYIYIFMPDHSNFGIKFVFLAPKTHKGALN